MKEKNAHGVRGLPVTVGLDQHPEDKLASLLPLTILMHLLGYLLHECRDDCVGVVLYYNPNLVWFAHCHPYIIFNSFIHLFVSFFANNYLYYILYNSIPIHIRVVDRNTVISIHSIAYAITKWCPMRSLNVGVLRSPSKPVLFHLNINSRCTTHKEFLPCSGMIAGAKALAWLKKKGRTKAHYACSIQ